MSDRLQSEMPTMQTILVIDDESLRDTIVVMLEQEGFRAVQAGDGREGFEMALSLKPDLVLVDLRLPRMSGTEICKQLRAARVATPIIVLSALGDEIDKVLLLEIGADDYVVKPFGTRELMARIRAVLRRASSDARKVIHFSEIEVDFERRIVKRKGEDLKLTPAEYNLLAYFLHNPDRALTRDMILNSAGGIQSAGLLPAQSRPGADARHDSEFGLGIRVLPEYADGGRARGETAAKTGTGQQRAASFSHRARRRVSLRAVRGEN